jgi:hypothetical protein
MMRHDASLALLLLLAGCAVGTPTRDTAIPAAMTAQAAPSADLTATQLLRDMVDTTAWPAEKLDAEIKRLQADQTTPALRFRLAWLMLRRGAQSAVRSEDLARAQNLLARVEDDRGDADSRKLLGLLQDMAQLQMELRQAHRHATTLTEKIELLKALERSLNVRGRREATP